MGFGPEPHFKRGERAYGAEPGLGDDDSNCGQVRQAEPQPANKAPATEGSDDDEDKPANNEQDDGEVNRQHPVG